MEGTPDFSGYATKAGLKCSDGRTITRDAFKDQDGLKVPLVWMHDHNGPQNVLGHAFLTNKEDGVYCDAFFNGTDQGKASKVLVQHGDIVALSIYANKLVEKDKEVLHGAIREVSLVISGANPGAKIDFVNLIHSDGSEELLDEEAVITSGLPLEIHMEHADAAVADAPADSAPADTTDTGVTEETLKQIFDSMSPQQQEATKFIAEAAAEVAAEEALAEAQLGAAENADANAADAAAAADAATKETPATPAVHSDITDGTSGDTLKADDTTTEGDLTHKEGSTTMANVFDGDATKAEGPTLNHSQIETIVNDMERCGSLKQSFLAHADEYGITNIDFLFPDAQNVTASPEWISRRQEWVANVLTATKHSPFSRIKSTAADITADEARAKGYVKGSKKKDEIIRLLKRVTTPKTIYKKQKLDRDDIIDITDLDVVVWLKAEMRLMLDEELARAILIGDGREPDDEDKIDEDHIRPIAYDDDMYAHQITLASNTAPNDVIKAVLRARTYYKGTGTPTFYTTDGVLTDMILLEDKVGRRLYETEEALAAAMRVKEIVTVEVMEDNPDLLGIVVNLADYTVGADRGGAVSMFDDFDIDFNQQKYLIETRVSGALTKPKSAVVLKQATGTVVSPTQPTYNPTTHVITIPSTTGVVYKVDDVTKSSGPMTAITETTTVEAYAAAGYTFPHNIDTDWTYVF